jgi:predicted membrane channel-forming protein YqfA (hemolysin III family)
MHDPDFSEPVYGGILLVLTNLVLIPAIAIALFIGRDLVTATILFLMFLVSTLYHICEAGWYCMVSFDTHQAADHMMVYTLLFWVFMVGTTRYRDVQFSMLLINTAALVVFVTVSTQTAIFGALYVAFFITWLIVSAAGFGIPPKPYGIFMLLIVVVLALVGLVPFFAGDDPGESKYWWAHSLWHVFVMLAIIFLLLALYGESIWKWYHELKGDTKRTWQPPFGTAPESRPKLGPQPYIPTRHG